MVDANEDARITLLNVLHSVPSTYYVICIYMGQCIGLGCRVNCSQGLIPAVLVVTPEKRVILGQVPLAGILDAKPFVNVATFGMCQSKLNPAVQAIIASSMGAVQVAPCIPAIITPWTPGNPRVLVSGTPVVTSNSKAMCAFGGQITLSANQFQVTSG